jgi:hypothetical protein
MYCIKNENPAPCLLSHGADKGNGFLNYAVLDGAIKYFTIPTMVTIKPTINKPCPRSRPLMIPVSISTAMNIMEAKRSIIPMIPNVTFVFVNLINNSSFSRIDKSIYRRLSIGNR